MDETPFEVGELDCWVEDEKICIGRWCGKAWEGYTALTKDEAKKLAEWLQLTSL